jgi:serine/threonine-protein kinase
LIQVGQVLDKYELLERVGQGGMAIVYRGIDRSLKRTVAIKILHKHLSE